MKKSKIIIPALAVLTLSTAAAVSGTVAWFTASRTANVGVTSTVINPEGELQVKTVAGKATAISGNAGIVMATNSALRDASVDAASVPGSIKAYSPKFDGEGVVTGYNDVTSADTTIAAVGNPATNYTVHYYATFQVEFTVPSADANAKFDVYFNETESECNEDEPAAIQNAYRVAMYQGSELCVWAPLRSTSVTYVNGTGASATGTYTLASGAISTASKTTAQADNKYLGTIEGTDKLTVNFVVWYDGLDASCITSNLGTLVTDTCGYTMNFQAINQTDYLA